MLLLSHETWKEAEAAYASCACRKHVKLQLRVLNQVTGPGCNVSAKHACAVEAASCNDGNFDYLIQKPVTQSHLKILVALPHVMCQLNTPGPRSDSVVTCNTKAKAAEGLLQWVSHSWRRQE